MTQPIRRRRSSSAGNLLPSVPPIPTGLTGIEAIDIGGIFFCAVCHKQGVDIINCDDARYVQTLKEKSAKYAAWSLRTFHLALLTDIDISIYKYTNDLVSMKPMWSKEKSINILSDCNEVKDDFVMGLSFQYPYLAVMQRDAVILHNCSNEEKYTLSSASGSPSIADLSYSGRTLALCSVASPRIDFMRVHKSGCSTLCHKEHSGEVMSIMWRPGFSTNRDMILACDKSNLVRVWAVEYKPSYNGSEVHADVHLLLELCDYVDRVAPFSWVQHGLSSQSEVNFINGSLSNKVNKTLSSSLSALSSHFSGSWLSVLDESGTVRLWCVHAHGISNHIECVLKGHGPLIQPSCTEKLNLQGYIVSGRFLSVGADKPISLQVIASYRLGAEDMPSRRHLVTIVHAETIKRSNVFVASTQRTTEFIVNGPSHDCCSIVATVSGRLPPRFCDDWQLVSWSNEEDDDESLMTSTSPLVSSTPRFYRALHAPLRGIEAMLWCWAHRHKSYESHNEMSLALPFLSHGAIDVSSADSGFEIAHDVLRALWIPQPVYHKDEEDIDDNRNQISSSNVSNELHSDIDIGKQQSIVTLQQPHLGSYVVAFWQTMPCPAAEGITQPNYSHFSLAPRDDAVASSCRLKEMGMVRGGSMDKRDTEISALHGSGGFDAYEVSIQPDPHFGLGLRLDICEGKILVESFKRNPLTTKPMPAEECGIIGIGDELMSVMGKSLKGQSLVEVIQIIRQVVQNSRGSAVVLQLRASNRTSIDSDENTRKFSTGADERSFSVDVESMGWYSNNATISDNSLNFHESNLTTDGKLNLNSSTPEANNTFGKESGFSNEYVVRIPPCKKWKLMKSFHVENVVAMDIVLGDYGESVSAGNCRMEMKGLMSHIIGVGASITRTKSVVDNEAFDLNIFEIFYHENDTSQCGFVKRLSVPWRGCEPTTLQLWNSNVASRSFVLAATHTASDSYRCVEPDERVSVGSITLLEITATEDSTICSSTPEDILTLGRSVTFESISSSWSLSPPMVIPAAFNHPSSGNTPSGHRSNYDSSQATMNAKTVENRWELLCCPLLESGKHIIVRNAFSRREVCILQLCSGELPNYLDTVCVDLTESQKFASTERTIGQENGLAVYGKFVQNIPFSEDVTWAKFLDDTTIQIGVGNKWYMYSYSLIAESTGLWMLHSEPAVFNGIHFPESLSLNAISTRSPWANGHFVEVTDYDKRGIISSNPPDWHALYMAIDLFSISSNPRDDFALLFDRSDCHKALGFVRSLVRGVYTSLCRFGLLSNAIVSSNTDSYQSYATKLLQHQHVTASFDFEKLLETITDMACKLCDADTCHSARRVCEFSPPLRLLRPCDIVLLSTLGSIFGELTGGLRAVSLSPSPLDFEKAVSYVDVSMFKDMDTWAVQSFLSFKLFGNLNQIMLKDESSLERKEGVLQRGCMRVGGDVVLNALVSSSQDALYDAFIGSHADQFTNSLGDRPQNKKEFNFSMLWWARNQAGRDSAHDYDILGALASVMAPVWLRDLSPVYDLVEKLSTAQYKDHRDSLKIFLELVVIQKTDKLLQLAKTDRNIMGKQLLQLLGMDFKTERGRQACHKNAFALLRLQRYKHAAAVFLCAEPPLLKEAVRVIIKHLRDPILALLISRLVEGRADADPVLGGHVLGPISRKIICDDILPVLLANIRLGGSNLSDKEIPLTNKKDPFGLHWGVDAGMLAISCSMWLQDIDKLRDTIDTCSQCDIFRYSATCSVYGIVRHFIGSCASMNWLMKQSISAPARVAFAGAFDSMLEQAGLTDLRSMGIDFLNGFVSSSSDTVCEFIEPFLDYCQVELAKWKNKVHLYNKQKSLSNEKSIVEDEPEFEDVTVAMRRLQSIASSNKEEPFEESAVEAARSIQKQSKGFNLSLSTSTNTSGALGVDDVEVQGVTSISSTVESSRSISKANSSVPANMLDMFGPPIPRQKSTPQSGSANMLDMFDVPPPNTMPKPKSMAQSEPVNMLDMYDTPLKNKPQSSHQSGPANMLDMFDSPPPKPKPKPEAMPRSEPANMLDMFDAPPPRPKPEAAPRSGPANMLDMFDAPPPTSKPTVTPRSEPANMLDMFDAPPPIPKPKATPRSEPANMLDMFDTPTPKSKKPDPGPRNMLDSFDVPPMTSRAKQMKRENMLEKFNTSSSISSPSRVINPCDGVNKEVGETGISDEESASVSNFNDSVFHVEKCDFENVAQCVPVGLSLPCRLSIISRCFDELQLSLGCIHTMSHPLSTSGQTRELLKVICHDVRSSLITGDVESLLCFRKCLRSLGDRFLDLILPHFKNHTMPSIKNLFVGNNDKDAVSTPADVLIAIFLLENRDFHNCVDQIALQVLLRWAAGFDVEDVHKILIAAAVSVFELFPVVSGAAHDSESSLLPFSSSAVTYMMVIARQLQLILSFNCNPATTKLIKENERLSPAVVALLGMTIRVCMTFVSLDYRYDITQKLLKYPPKFNFSSINLVNFKGSNDAVHVEDDCAHKNWLEKNPILTNDPGHMYFRDMERPQAISTLKVLPKGAFLLRPHPQQEAIVYLSFVTDSSGSVKHAIIRNDTGPTNEPNYRCGKVGPCATIEIALRSISKILPTSLIFDPTLVPNGPSSFAGIVREIDAKKSSGVSENTEQVSSEQYHNRLAVSMIHFGSFAGDIPDDVEHMSHEVTSVDDVKWDPNGEFWFSLPTQEVSVNGYQLSMNTQSPSPSSEAGSYDESFFRNMDFCEEDYSSGYDSSCSTGVKKSTEEVAIFSWENKDVTSINSSNSVDTDIDPAWQVPLTDNCLGSLARGIAHMLAVKTVFKQIASSFESLSTLMANDPTVMRYLKYIVQLRYEGKVPHDMLHSTSGGMVDDSKRGSKGNSKTTEEKMFPRSKISVLESFLAPLSIFLYTNERVVLNSLSPALPLDPTVFISNDFSMGESLMEQILHERIGVPLRHVKLPHAAVSHISGSTEMRPSSPMLNVGSGGGSPKADGGDDVVECIESTDVIRWIKKHMDAEILSTMLQSKSEDVTGEHVLKWLWDNRVLQNIVIESGGYSSTKHNFFRYIDPWEVSVVRDQSAILTSCRLGRGWYSAVSAYSAVDMVESVVRHIRKENNDFDGGFVKLWESLRAEAWLVMSISTSHEQGEREAGGPAVTELTSSTLGASDPYHSCLARHLYRNALFERISMPHRFVAVLQIDTFALKDLSPHKYMSGVASTPIEVYAVAKLVRTRSGRKYESKALTDTLVTPARKIEAGKQDVSSQPSEYSWREQGVLRFPLPDRVLAIGPFTEGSDKNIRQPPRKLLLSVYETRSFFSDQKLGELELPLSGLSDERPFRDWLPLSSEKGAAWFAHVQMQLRFVLMTKDEYRDTTIRSRKGQSKKVSKSDSLVKKAATGSLKAKERDSLSQKAGGTIEENRNSTGPIAAPVMYSIGSISPENSIGRNLSSNSPQLTSSASEKVGNMNDLMSDFF